MPRPFSTLLVLASLATAAQADDAVTGLETLFQSPNGVTERCVRITPMPGATYTEADLAAESRYCALDIYAPTTGLCPKTWSTSPAMMLYDLSSGPYASDRAGFAATACLEGKDARDFSAGEIARLKSSMNDPTTSGTYSPSPLLYYHLSRYLGSDVGVPPSVWRSMDRAAHLALIAEPGVTVSAVRESADLLQSAWAIMVRADADPATYVPTDDLYTADRTALFGAMMLNVGDDYGPEINGTSTAEWGADLNRGFQLTAPYLALRTDAPLPDAIAQGIAAAQADPVLAEAMGPNPDPRQMAYWMADVANIALLDFILGQQDRVGNIDYVAHWMWSDNGTLVTQEAGEEDEAPPVADAVLIRRTHINDNDAGLRLEYENFARTTGMLDNLRRFPAGPYRQLMALDADLRAEGPLFRYLQTSFGLPDPVFRQLVVNVTDAATILRDQCVAGTLAFDLDPAAFLLTGAAAPATVDCTTG